MTFGSVIGHLPEATGVYGMALDAVSGLAARVLLTVGRAMDPGRGGPVPDNTHVEQWVPQSDVLTHAAVVVCHGGSGTTFGALAAGVPLVICPLFADQSMNGRLWRRRGAGLSSADATLPLASCEASAGPMSRRCAMPSSVSLASPPTAQQPTRSRPNSPLSRNSTSSLSTWPDATSFPDPPRAGGCRASPSSRQTRAAVVL